MSKCHAGAKKGQERRARREPIPRACRVAVPWHPCPRCVGSPRTLVGAEGWQLPAEPWENPGTGWVMPGMGSPWLGAGWEPRGRGKSSLARSSGMLGVHWVQGSSWQVPPTVHRPAPGWGQGCRQPVSPGVSLGSCYGRGLRWAGWVCHPGCIPAPLQGSGTVPQLCRAPLSHRIPPSPLG